MLLVPCRIGRSKIEGLGVFTETPVVAGQIVWRFDEQFDLLVRKDDLAEAPETIRRHWERFAFELAKYPGYMLLDGDDGRFMNHCDRPNLDFSEAGVAVARQGIEAGEELTCNYNEISFLPFEMEPARTI